jgi:hypothetical protein
MIHFCISRQYQAPADRGDAYAVYRFGQVDAWFSCLPLRLQLYQILIGVNANQAVRHQRSKSCNHLSEFLSFWYCLFAFADFLERPARRRNVPRMAALAIQPLASASMDGWISLKITRLAKINAPVLLPWVLTLGISYFF